MFESPKKNRERTLGNKNTMRTIVSIDCVRSPSGARRQHDRATARNGRPLTIRTQVQITRTHILAPLPTPASDNRNAAAVLRILCASTRSRPSARHSRHSQTASTAYGGEGESKSRRSQASATTHILLEKLRFPSRIFEITCLTSSGLQADGKWYRRALDINYARH